MLVITGVVASGGHTDTAGAHMTNEHCKRYVVQCAEVSEYSDWAKWYHGKSGGVPDWSIGIDWVVVLAPDAETALVCARAFDLHADDANAHDELQRCYRLYSEIRRGDRYTAEGMEPCIRASKMGDALVGKVSLRAAMALGMGL